jgi:hypothetical protein
VRQVDHVHDAEDQRQPGGEQEQHQAELQPVERLLEDEDAGHRSAPQRQGCEERVAPHFIAQFCT